jgi:putative acetyltransferase
MPIEKAQDRNIAVLVTDPYCAEAVALFQALWDELGVMYGDTGPCRFLPEHVAGPGTAFLIAWQDGQPVGCGAIRPFLPGVAEVKRMYVVSEARKQGFAQRILTELEHLGRGMGYVRLQLETGQPQQDAIRLYERAGWERIECFGEYADDPRSVCFGKQIA